MLFFEAQADTLTIAAERELSGNVQSGYEAKQEYECAAVTRFY